MLLGNNTDENHRHPTKAYQLSSDLTVRIIDPKKEPFWVERISKMLTASSEMFKLSNGGHVPDRIVSEIVHRKYTSPQSITNTFSTTGYRFVLVDERAKHLVGTLLIGRTHHRILVKDSQHINVLASNHPNFAPRGYHHAFNLSIDRELRCRNLGRTFIDCILSNFGELFDGMGIWIHAEPPWHEVFVKMNFRHATEFDQFFHDDVELPPDIETAAQFNQPFVCSCMRNHEQLAQVRECKYKYQVFMKDFFPATTRANHLG